MGGIDTHDGDTMMREMRYQDTGAIYRVVSYGRLSGSALTRS